MTRGAVLRTDGLDLDHLRRAAVGEDTQLPPAMALALLGRREYEEKLEDLRAALANDSLDVRARRVAAVELGRMETAAARSVLLAHAETPDPVLRRSVQDVLNRRGEPGAAPGGARVAASGLVQAVRRRPRDVRLPTGGQRLRVDPATGREGGVASELATLEEALAGIADSDFPAELRPEGGFVVRFAGYEAVFLLNAELPLQGLRDHLQEAARAFFGVVASALRPEAELPEDRRWTVCYALFAERNDGQVRLVGVTGSGKQALEGQLDSSGRFEVASTAHPGAFPFLVEGIVSDAGIQARRFVWQPSPEAAGIILSPGHRERHL